MNTNDLIERLFEFSVVCIKFLSELPYSPESKVIREQLTRSSTSSGANYEESQAGSSKADFINKVLISLKEMRESNYWLRLIKRVIKLNQEKNDKVEELIKESNELKKILGAIIVKARKNSDGKTQN